MAETQISAYISDEAKAALEAYVKQYGVKKAYVIEEALLHHLQALREIPEDIVVPARLVLSEKSMREVADRHSAVEEPSEALKALFRD
jgi:predicted DNA-binding protein